MENKKAEGAKTWEIFQSISYLCNLVDTTYLSIFLASRAPFQLPLYSV